MKTTVRTILAVCAAAAICSTKASASSYGYNNNGTYCNWYSTPNGGFGYEGYGNYYNWYSARDGGGYGWDSRGDCWCYYGY